MIKLAELRCTALLLTLCAACGPGLPGEGDGEGDAENDSGSDVLTSTGEVSPPPDPPPTIDGTTTGDPDPDSSGTTDGGFIQPTGGCVLEEEGASWHCILEDCLVFGDSCPEGEQCVPWANDGSNEWNASRCSPVDPLPASEGDPCLAEESATSGFDNCDFGSMCWGVDPETLMGTCRSLCDIDEEGMCFGSANCVPLNNGNVPLCLTPCNPLDPSTCTEDEGCRSVEASNGNGTYCLPLVGGIVTDSGMSCGETSCDLDSMCLPGSFTPLCRDECCSPWCDLTDPMADEVCALADPSLSCTSYYEPGMAPEGQATLGVCSAPP